MLAPRPSLLFFASGLLYQASSVMGAPTTSCSHSKPAQRFDYVIVGGGTAGLVLANRLTEDPTVRVAVIEAGTFPEDVSGNWSQVPGYAGNFITGAPEMSWNFHTTPQVGANGHSFPYYRAKALGGCSSINFMAYAHTSESAHEMWANQVGDESYTYSNMLKYYRRTMNFSPPREDVRFRNATPQYNAVDTATGGGLDVTYASYAQPWSTWVAEGLEAIGIPRRDHFINGNLLGQSWQMNTITQSNGFRSSSETAYLRPYLDRHNLALFRNTLAERIVFNQRKEATGVEVTTQDTTCFISARKEVILSAGAFQSPQLLQVSGVGPAALLQRFDINVIADRPGVGQNMEDHITVPLSYRVNVETASALLNSDYMAQAIDEFNNEAAGPLASAGGDYMAMEKVPQELRAGFSRETVRELPADWPEVSFSVYPNGIPRSNLTGEEPVPGANYAALLATLIAPQSRGSVSIASPRMSDPPLIDLNLFTAQADREVMIAAVKRARQALQSQAMAPILIAEEYLPGNGVQTDEEILEYLIHTLNPLFHAFASNRMGKTSDPMAVVDNHGRVIGVKKLRVVDSSSFPFLPPGPAPQIQVYLLAEKLADDIKRG
ncbi:hypothetical protein DL764_009474 [Monosporascus ibericus]|uniref:Glucose-methanol-choline oxidoreductase N-terminal domain-containing protein n=1 Tax=Monosporascus ibericus TaxID=155417 RepID=A0A4Q4SWY7_9PEZI|nr:hypothetical protein DL764_009474 [Monosporascus ibericus]